MQLSKIAAYSHRVLLNRVFLQTLSSARSKFTSLNLVPTSTSLRKYSQNKSDEIAGNPFFDKYKDKIRHMQNTNPAEYEDKMKELAKRLHPQVADKNEQSMESSEGSSAKPVKITRPSEAARAGVGMTKARKLDSIMKTELLEDKTADEITKIWNQYHCDKDCIYTVLKDHEFQNLLEKSKECPVFVLPIRRNDGFEMILTQFDRHDVYFTPLSMFQLVKEDSPPCLTLNHFTELMDSKGIVLMVGQYDEKALWAIGRRIWADFSKRVPFMKFCVLANDESKVKVKKSQQLALSLVQQVSIFYGKNSKFDHLVQKFNHTPEKFDYNELIDAFKGLPQYDMQ